METTPVYRFNPPEKSHKITMSALCRLLPFSVRQQPTRSGHSTIRTLPALRQGVAVGHLVSSIPPSSTGVGRPPPKPPVRSYGAATLQRTPVGTKRLARRGYLALRVLNCSFPAIRAKWLAQVTATQPQCSHLHCGCQGSRSTRTRCCVSRLSNSRLQNKFCNVQVFNFLLVWCELAT